MKFVSTLAHNSVPFYPDWSMAHAGNLPEKDGEKEREIDLTAVPY